MSELGKRHKVSRKMVNLGIRLGARTSQRKIIIPLYEKASILAKWLLLGQGISLNLSIGTGYDETFFPKKKRLNVGYFQSDKNCSDESVFSELMKMYPIDPSQNFLKLIDEIRTSKPIIVHMRLGDYLAESSFGLPSRDYYLQAINLLEAPEKKRRIWLFSNEPEKALELFPNELKSLVFLVPNKGLTSAETLELMRNGQDYVIANSTFSWWGAMLSRNPGKRVIMPTPWFKIGESPIGIYPKNWTQLPARYMEDFSEIGVTHE